MTKKILAIVSLAVFCASMTSANVDIVTLSCSEKNGTLNPFEMSFERPKSPTFSMPVQIISVNVINSGTISGYEEEEFTRLRGYYMLSIFANGPLGPLSLELAADPNWEHAFGHGVNSSLNTLFLSCKQNN